MMSVRSRCQGLHGCVKYRVNVEGGSVGRQCIAAALSVGPSLLYNSTDSINLNQHYHLVVRCVSERHSSMIGGVASSLVQRESARASGRRGGR
jgi:hypothetical protein